jgi:glycosyltransferase involved in cell wall biosynthesis
MRDTRRVRISVVIPCYRSRDTLPALVAGLHEELPKVATDYEIILVVDGSPDDTYAQARRLEVAEPDRVRALLLRRNYGQHNALMAGLTRARYEVTVTMDDDLQHRPDQVSALVQPLRHPVVDLVYGQATEEEHGWARSAASRTVKAGLALAGVPNARQVSAFRAFRTELREGFAHIADPFVSLDVVLSWTTTSVIGVPVVMDERTNGRSNYSLGGLARHAWNMVTGYGTIPLRLVVWLGFLCSLAGLFGLVYILVAHAMGRIQVAGFTTLVALLTAFSGAMMLSIGVLGEYIGRLHFRSMQRPAFLVRVDGHEGGPWAGVPGLELPHVPETAQLAPDAVARAVTAADPDRAEAAQSRRPDPSDVTR